MTRARCKLVLIGSARAARRVPMMEELLAALGRGDGGVLLEASSASAAV